MVITKISVQSELFAFLITILEKTSSKIGASKTWLNSRKAFPSSEVQKIVEIIVSEGLADWRENRLIATQKGVSFVETYRRMLRRLR